MSDMSGPERQLILEPIPGLDAKRNSGMVDVSLFTGGNKLWAKRDDQAGLWYFQYEKGVLPEPLKQRFTSFKVLNKFAEEYFKKRNIRIAEIKR
jgi:hypothetical protein